MSPNTTAALALGVAGALTVAAPVTTPLAAQGEHGGYRGSGEHGPPAVMPYGGHGGYVARGTPVRQQSVAWACAVGLVCNTPANSGYYGYSAAGHGNEHAAAPRYYPPQYYPQAYNGSHGAVGGLSGLLGLGRPRPRGYGYGARRDHDRDGLPDRLEGRGRGRRNGWYNQPYPQGRANSPWGWILGGGRRGH